MQIGILRVLNVLPSKMNIKIEIFKGICVAGAFCGVKVSVQDESGIYVLRKSSMRVILIEAPIVVGPSHSGHFHSLVQ